MVVELAWEDLSRTGAVHLFIGRETSQGPPEPPTGRPITWALGCQRQQLKVSTQPHAVRRRREWTRPQTPSRGRAQPSQLAWGPRLSPGVAVPGPSRHPHPLGSPPGSRANYNRLVCAAGCCERRRRGCRPTWVLLQDPTLLCGLGQAIGPSVPLFSYLHNEKNALYLTLARRFSKQMCAEP